MIADCGQHHHQPVIAPSSASFLNPVGIVVSIWNFLLSRVNSPSACERSYESSTRLRTYRDSTAVQERFHLRASEKSENSPEDEKLAWGRNRRERWETGKDWVLSELNFSHRNNKTMKKTTSIIVSNTTAYYFLIKVSGSLQRHTPYGLVV